MNEKAISAAYDLAVNNGYKKSIDEFKVLLSSNDKALNTSFDLAIQNGYKKSLDEYKTLMGVGSSAPAPQNIFAEEVKKKEDITGLQSADGSLALSESADPEALRFAELVKEQGEVVGKRRDEPGYVDPRSSLGMYPTKEDANKAMTQAMADIRASKGMASEFEEKDFFEGGFGKALRVFDNYSPIPLGEAIDDVARTLATGYAAGQLSSAANDLAISGTIPNDKTIEKLIKYSKMSEELGPSDAFINYQKKSEESGGGFWGFFRGVADNPAVLPELVVSSLTTMATNKEAVLTGATALLTNAVATAAAAGAPTLGAGAAPGFIAGAGAALPVAMGLASGIVTTGSTFAELIQQELGTDESGNPVEMTKENVRAILEDPEKLNKIRNKSIIKGATVGAIDFFSGKLASTVGAKILSKSAATSATGEATKAAYTKSLLAGAPIESAGGGLGEGLGTALAGEKQSLENILFEMVAEVPMTAVSTLQARLASPVYKVNNKNVTAEQIDEIINTMNPDDLAVANIKIENDYDGRKKRIQDKIVTGSIANQVREAQPNLNEPTVNAIVELQKELNKLEGNKTQVAKDKAAQIRADIKNLQENQLPDTVTQETPTYKVDGKDVTADVIDELISTKSREELLAMDIQINNDTEGRVDRFQEVIGTPSAKAAPEVTQKRDARISEIESIIAYDDATFDETGNRPLLAEARTMLQTELQTLKAEQDAIQEQAAGQVPVQSETGVSQEVQEGLASTEPQGVTQEGQEKIDEIERRRQEELDRYENRRANSLVKYNPDGENIELTESEIEKAEMIINSAKERGLDVDRTQKLLQTNGFIQSVGNSATAFREFLRGRLSGEINNKVNGEFLDTINAKYDAKLKALEQDTKQQPNVDTKAVAQIEVAIGETVTIDGIKYTKVETALVGEEKGIAYQDENGMSYKAEWVESQLKKQAEPQVQEEVTTEEVSSKTRVNIAPFFNTKVETREEAEQLRQAPEYKSYKEMLVKLAEQLGIPKIKIDDVIGGYKNESGEEIVEISNQITFEDATLDQVEEYAAIVASLAPEVQEASIAAQYVNEGDATHNANEYRFKVSDINNAIKALKGAGITDFSINEAESTVVFTDVFDFADAQLQDKIGKFAELLDENNISYEQQQFRPTESRYVDKGKRKEIIRRVKSDGPGLESRGQGFNETLEQAIQRDADFQGTTYEEYAGAKPKGPAAGNRLFNEPLKAVAEIANRYYQRAFGTKRPDFKGTRILDKERAKRLSDAFEAMKHSPNDPEVRAAYNALAKETIEQYKAFLDAGYVVEINNNEPYANSQEMIDDLRNNKRIKIFSTESGFGDTPITAKQRKENPLLAKTKFKDVNGQPMLVNDLFRAVHDFFGHAELGNSFGPLGEENAWNVHARMYSPLARRAMTTETRGQNSFVNFSGVNEEVNRIREQARKLREEGKLEEALKLTDEIYEKTSFADQKVGLLPEEFSQIDEEVTTEPVVQEEIIEEVVDEPMTEFTPIESSEVKTELFTKDNAIDYEEDVREGSNGREYSYISSITVEATDANGDTIGSITKLADEDGVLTFIAEDTDGRQIGRGKEYDTLGQAKSALADHVNKQRQKEFEKEQKKVAKEKEKATAKAEKAKAREKAKQKAKEPQVEEEVVEEIQGKMDELLDLNPKERGAGQKILDGLDRMIKDIEKFEKGTLGVNIAIPIMKGILQTVRGLVQAGMTLKDAIKKAASDNGTTVRQVVNGINAISQIAPIQGAYDSLMTKADALIARQKSRNIADKKIVSNLDTMIRNSEVYKNANDAQRKIMEREARLKMGVGPRKAASIGRVIGVLKDITSVSRKEKLQIVSRIRELSRDVAKDLAEEIRGLAKEGKITAIQATNIIAKFGNVNLLNEVSVSNFVDYMAKVFSDAEYDSKISKAKSRMAKARRNIATKIGIADGLITPLRRLFAINPNLIPENSLERYIELLNMFSANEAVLTLDEKDTVKKDVEAILNEINNEQSRADELTDVFGNSNNQVFKDGDLDYAASIKKMVKEGEITEDDATLMRKYKQEIIPQVEQSSLSEEDIAKKKDEYISALRKQEVSSDGLPSNDEKNLANRLKNLIKETSPANLMSLSLTDLKNLLKVIDNINNNYLPHYAQVMVEKITAINNGKAVASSIKKAKPLKFSALYSKFKAAVIRSRKGGIAEMVRRNPLFYIDQVFGDFKTKNLFNALFEKAAEGEAKFKAELKKVQNILENAEAKVAKSFKLDPDKTLMSKFKMMTYMIQLEYESNKGSGQVNPASEYLKETIKHIDGGKSRFGERDANMLQDILDKYSKDGQIDIDKLFNSFNQAEKDAIKAIRGINESLKDKAEYTAAIIRGDSISTLNNYIHLNVLHDTEPNDMSASTDFLNQMNNSRRPSTKAKSLIERTPGAKPLNFDVFSSAQRGAKFVLMDYNLTEPIRTARRTLNQATADLEAEGRLPKGQRDIKNAIEFAFEEAVENLLTNSILQNSLADEAIDFISKQGYRAVLAGTGRFAAELTSNIAFAVLADPKAFSTGTKMSGFIMSNDAAKVLQNVNSKQTNRIFPSDTLSGKIVDTSILSQASGIQGSSSKNPVLNKMQQIYNLTLKKPQNLVELTADALISTPDKLVMRPLWFGSFANEFKGITGSDVDFQKIADNDQAYMDANKDAIDKAKKAADEKSVMAGATDNAFMGILKGTVKPNQSFSTRAFNNFNNYMTRFMIFEYLTARTGIYALVGDGSLSKRQGAAMLAAVATRMTVYTLLSQALANGIMGLFGLDEDEEEDEKSLTQKIGQSLTSTFTSLLLGRDFGNATKLFINYGLEEINEKYLDFLREGEYDPYKDGIAFSLIPREERPNDSLSNLLMKMSGALAPAYNTADLIYRNRNRIITGETTKKELDAIEREDRTVKERIPLELLGLFGFVPIYKDVRKIVINSIYSSVKDAERAAKRSKQIQKDLLGGYDNKTDLKRYNPKLYEKNFGENSDWYKSTKEEREEKEKQAKKERAIKDRIYDYSPNDNDGFGSAGFGKSKPKRSKKGQGEFGSDKFGN